MFAGVLEYYKNLLMCKKAKVGCAHPKVPTDAESWKLVDQYMFLAFVSKTWSSTKRKYMLKVEKRLIKGVKSAAKKALHGLANAI